MRRPRQLVTDEPGRWRDALFEPGDVVEIRCLPPRTINNSPRQFMWRKTAYQHGVHPWLFSEEIEVVVNKLTDLNEGAATWWGRWDREAMLWSDVTALPGIPLNVYASPNPRIAKGCSKSSDVFFARSLFADLENITAEEALGRVAAVGLPRPTMLVVSGHGVHLYWRLLELVADLDLWTGLQKRLIDLLGSDPAVHDPARLMRLPGFLNVNGTLARCYIYKVDPDRRYDLRELEAVLPALEPRPERPTSSVRLSIVGQGPSTASSLDHGARLDRASAYAARFEPSQEGERNSKLFARSCDLFEKFGLTAEEALEVIQPVNDKSDEPLDDVEVEETVQKAFVHVEKKGGPKGTLLKAVVRVEPYQEPQEEVVDLETWRRQMQQARTESLEEPGIYLDASTTGAGKSTADQEAMKRTGASLTVLPTHDACNELVQALAANDIQAAAHPPLDATTCTQFGTDKRPGPAQKALKAGLNVGQAVCPTCKHIKTCEYQRRREAARSAAHTVATHARASHSEFQPAEGKPVIFIHEDPLALFRPMVKVVRHNPKADVPQARHLREIAQLAVQAGEIARSWQDHGLIAFSQRLGGAATHLANILDSDDLLGPIITADQTGLPTKGLPTVQRLDVPAHAAEVDAADLEDVTGWATSAGPLHPNIDALLNEAMNKSDTVPNGPALKLAVAYTRGELTTLCAVIDEEFVKGGKRRFRKALVGVWSVRPPENSVVWLENAHTEAGHLSEIVGRPVIDRTPQGRLAYEVPPIQYADQDVTQRTSPGVVRGLLRKVLSLYPDARKVGVITHQRHVRVVERLDAFWMKRLPKIEYFHSGKDRASNAWLNCDLIVVLGTPRVPPAAVRDGLIRLGQIEAATRDGNFGPVEWEGKTVAGNLVRHRGHGYGDPAWAKMQRVLVKEALLQAVGRGRGVTSRGVPVVVVSNENLGLPLADCPLRPLTDPQDELLRLVAELTAQIAKDTTLASRAVTTAEVVRRSRHKERNVRKLLASLSTHGLLKRKGARGGWLLAG